MKYSIEAYTNVRKDGRHDAGFVVTSDEGVETEYLVSILCPDEYERFHNMTEEQRLQYLKQGAAGLGMYIACEKIADRLNGEWLRKLPQWRHVKRGSLYRLLGEAPLQASGKMSEYEGVTLCIYQSVDTGTIYARPHHEFYDGRFEEQK